jgi:hypothetical protein
MRVVRMDVQVMEDLVFICTSFLHYFITAAWGHQLTHGVSDGGN